MPFFRIPANLRPGTDQEGVRSWSSFGDWGPGILRFGPVIQIQQHHLPPGTGLFRFDRQSIHLMTVHSGLPLMKTSTGFYQTLQPQSVLSWHSGGGTTISLETDPDAGAMITEFQLLPTALFDRSSLVTTRFHHREGLSGFLEEQAGGFRMVSGELFPFEETSLGLSNPDNGLLLVFLEGTCQIGGDIAGPGDVVGVYDYDRIQFMPQTRLSLVGLEVEMSG
ncbi:MAG: hypothetical protein HUU10_13960 [Bacteroidetes bacterium]|nr:hypothetical protein [Bacteroidota bacterium]